MLSWWVFEKSDVVCQLYCQLLLAIVGPEVSDTLGVVVGAMGSDEVGQSVGQRQTWWTCWCKSRWHLNCFVNGWLPFKRNQRGLPTRSWCHLWFCWQCTWSGSWHIWWSNASALWSSYRWRWRCLSMTAETLPCALNGVMDKHTLGYFDRRTVDGDEVGPYHSLIH